MLWMNQNRHDHTCHLTLNPKVSNIRAEKDDLGHLTLCCTIAFALRRFVLGTVEEASMYCNIVCYSSHHMSRPPQDKKMAT